jgi:hypothetical protein
MPTRSTTQAGATAHGFAATGALRTVTRPHSRGPYPCRDACTRGSQAQAGVLGHRATTALSDVGAGSWIVRPGQMTSFARLAAATGRTAVRELRPVDLMRCLGRSGREPRNCAAAANSSARCWPRCRPRRQRGVAGPGHAAGTGRRPRRRSSYAARRADHDWRGRNHVDFGSYGGPMPG